MDNIFSPENVLASPLNQPDKFLKREYFLNQEQYKAKREIVKSIESGKGNFYGIKGAAGTGKSLILYDIGLKMASKGKNVLVVHGGKLCDGHEYLNSNVPNMKIIPASDMRYREIKNVDIVLMDESQRIYPSIIQKAYNWVIKAGAICIFSYDEKQILSISEKINNSSALIDYICGVNTHKLSGKVRTNKCLTEFIGKLFHLPKTKRERHYDDVDIIYIESKKEAMGVAESLQNKGYTYISLTPGFVSSSLDYQASDLNTHRVIGQEFDRVCMIMDDNFFYDGTDLSAKIHPYRNYLLTKLLYQGLTRARSKITLIVTDQALLDNILKIFGI